MGPLFDSKSKKMYRPTNIDEDVYGIQGDDILNERNDNRKKNGKRKGFEFEKDDSSQSQSEKDELMENLNRYTSTKKKKQIENRNKGFLYAAGGQSIQNADEYVAGKRDRVNFVHGDNQKNQNDEMKPGLFYTENAKKEKEKRERDKRKRRRHSRSRSPQRSRSKKRQRRDYNDKYDDDRGRWGDGR